MKLLIPTLTILLLLPALVAAATISVASGPSALPASPLFPWVPPGGFPDAFPVGQCTWWAAYNHPVTWGGNAGDWLVHARAQGVTTAGEPSRGAIVVFRPGNGYSQLGHVAIVTGVGPGTYAISEMNFVGWNQVDTRVISWPDPRTQGFIPMVGGQ